MTNVRPPLFELWRRGTEAAKAFVQSDEVRGAVRDVKKRAAEVLADAHDKLEALAKQAEPAAKAPEQPIPTATEKPVVVETPVTTVSATHAESIGYRRVLEPEAPAPAPVVVDDAAYVTSHASAKAAPFYSAWLAAGRGKDTAAMTASLVALLDGASPEIATALKQTLVQAKVVSPELAWPVLQAGAVAAARLADGDTPFDAWTTGWSACLEVVTDGTPASNVLQASVWREALTMIGATLPDASPAHAALTTGLDAMNGKGARDASLTAALALGTACHWIDHGCAPEVNGEGLPRLPAALTVRPITAKRFSGPLFDGVPKPSDVGQNTLVYNCGLAATWTAIAATCPGSITHLLSETVLNGARTFTMQDYLRGPNGTMTEQTTDSGERFYVHRDGCPMTGTNAEGVLAPLWFAVAEKTYGRTAEGADYAGTEGETPHAIMNRIFGTTDARRFSVGINRPADVADELRANLEAGRPMVASTYLNSGIIDYAETRLIDAHVYAVTGLADRDGATYVTLVNPIVPRDLPLPEAVNAMIERLNGGVSRHLDKSKAFGTFELPIADFAHAIDTLFSVTPPGL